QEIYDWFNTHPETTPRFDFRIHEKRGVLALILQDKGEELMIYHPLPSSKEAIEKGVGWCFDIIQSGGLYVILDDKKFGIQGLGQSMRDLLQSQILEHLTKKEDREDKIGAMFG
ncbi:MAG: hypothetical protein ACTSRU_14310, partial [Candidatus Hodarchaeales archaeon]